MTICNAKIRMMKKNDEIIEERVTVCEGPAMPPLTVDPNEEYQCEI